MELIEIKENEWENLPQFTYIEAGNRKGYFWAVDDFGEEVLYTDAEKGNLRGHGIEKGWYRKPEPKLIPVTEIPYIIDCYADGMEPNEIAESITGIAEPKEVTRFQGKNIPYASMIAFKVDWDKYPKAWDDLEKDKSYTVIIQEA